jgi:hypothetical protein
VVPVHGATMPKAKRGRRRKAKVIDLVQRRLLRDLGRRS